MRFNNPLVLAVALLACAAASAQTNKYANGGQARTTPEEIESHGTSPCIRRARDYRPGKAPRSKAHPFLCGPLRDVCHGTTGKEGEVPLAPKLIGDTTYEEGPL